MFQSNTRSQREPNDASLLLLGAPADSWHTRVVGVGMSMGGVGFGVLCSLGGGACGVLGAEREGVTDGRGRKRGQAEGDCERKGRG